MGKEEHHGTKFFVIKSFKTIFNRRLLIKNKIGHLFG